MPPLINLRMMHKCYPMPWSIENDALAPVWWQGGRWILALGTGEMPVACCPWCGRQLSSLGMSAAEQGGI